MILSSEMREHHQFVENTLQNTAEVLQIPEVVHALGDERVGEFTNLIDRFYQPNLQKISTNLGHQALLAYMPMEHAASDNIPILASHANEQVYIDVVYAQIYTPAEEQMSTYAKTLYPWAGKNRDVCGYYLELLRSGFPFAMEYNQYPLTLTEDTLARVVTPQITEELSDIHYPLKPEKQVIFQSRPITQFRMDVETNSRQPAQRLDPASTLHEMQHAVDTLKTPVITPKQLSDVLVTTELKAHKVNYDVGVALGLSGYNGNDTDTWVSLYIPKLVETARRLANTASDPFAPNPAIKNLLINAGYGNVLGLNKEAAALEAERKEARKKRKNAPTFF